MGVNIDGATSGSPGKNFIYTMPQGSDQPVLNTPGNGTSPGINWGPQPTGNEDRNVSPDVPNSGIPGTNIRDTGDMEYKDSTDYTQPDIRHLDNLNAYAPADIFRGAPNTGIAGGPATPGRG